MSPQLPFLSSPLTSHEQVIDRACRIGRVNRLARVVVASAEESDVLAAMSECREAGIADAILVGNPDNIRAALAAAAISHDTFEIVPAEDDEQSALFAAQLAGEGHADVVMKGFLKTSTLLRTLLKHEHGLRDRELLSHSALLYVPRYGKLLNVTDGGTIPAPTLQQKLIVIANGVRVLRSVGVRTPKVAVLAPAASVRDCYPETLAAAELARIAADQWRGEIEISGPLTLDMVLAGPRALAIDRSDPVAGDADILLVHTLEEGNIVAKTLIQFGGAVFMGVIAGARVPISLVSRSDTMLNKMASIALAVCLADYQRRDFPALPLIDPGRAEVRR